LQRRRQRKIHRSDALRINGPFGRVLTDEAYGLPTVFFRPRPSLLDRFSTNRRSLHCGTRVRQHSEQVLQEGRHVRIVFRRVCHAVLENERRNLLLREPTRHVIAFVVDHQKAERASWCNDQRCTIRRASGRFEHRDRRNDDIPDHAIRLCASRHIHLLLVPSPLLRAGRHTGAGPYREYACGI
jgi:hypothetical protein